MPKRYKIAIVFLIFLGISVFSVSSDQKNDSFNVAIFKDADLSSTAVPDDLTPEWIAGVIKDDYNVIFLGTDELKDKSLFNTDRVDLLIFSYREVVSEEAISSIVEFIRDGGGIFTTGGMPFGDKYLSNIGVGHYIIHKEDIASMETRGDILDLDFELKEPFFDQHGLVIKNSERIYNKIPTMGNVFPFRIPARDFMNPLIFLDKHGNYIGAPITLVKSWANPYKDIDNVPNKWCLIGIMDGGHPLDAEDNDSERRLKDILKFLSTKIILKSIETEYASYKNGENVNLTMEVLNYGNVRKEVELDISIISEEEVLFDVKKNISINPGEVKRIKTIWDPGTLERDFYEVSAVLKLDNRIIDEGRNAFTAWHGDRLMDFPDLSVEGRYFYQGDHQVYLHGINYYESKTGGLMWSRPNISDIERDLGLMSSFGINFLRVHYHHPGWFRDYFEAVDLPVSDWFKETEGIERSLRIMDAFIVLCNKYGIYFQPDIFTLVPKEMGDPKGWIGDVGRCRDGEKIKKQKEFVKILIDRYRGIPNIIWDLWNEPFLQKGQIGFLKDWTRDMVNSFRLNGDRHLITIGSDESVELADDLDFLCGHGYDVNIPDTNKPFIMQEAWHESDLSSEREQAQAEKLEENFVACIKQGGAGFAPWQWTRQSCLWDDASEPERWDNGLGLCVREDGSIKPAGRLYKDLIKGML